MELDSIDFQYIMENLPVKIIGSHGSPYSMKMLAVLRYKRITFQWILRGSKDDPNPDIPVNLIPIIIFPGKDGSYSEATIDSSPLIRTLDNMYPNRRVTPVDPVLDLIDTLIEDFGDEWVTKMMFHYRWTYEEDIEKAGTILPLWGRLTISQDDHNFMKKMISERQISRLAIVGSNEVTGEVIENSYLETLKVIESIISKQDFIMGQRPGSSDFGLFGQLSQLVLFDPTSSEVAIKTSPRTAAWCYDMQELSGINVIEGNWISYESINQTLGPLLDLVGKYYVPFLRANAKALERGESSVKCVIDGKEWVQSSFSYQGKCYKHILEKYFSLDKNNREIVNKIFSKTGCENLFED